jgi:hypothetical protein
MKTTPDNQKLLDLVDLGRKGKIVLPQFQRNFVWGRDDITDLLTSILQGHFIGSFLMLETEHDNVPFAYRALEGVQIYPEQLKPDLMVLDGQQRLTSLHYVFAAPQISLRWTKYPYRFFLNLKEVTAGNLDRAIFSERADYSGQYLEQQYQFDNLVVPFTVLETWDQWLFQYEQWLANQDRDRYFNEYFPVYRPKWAEAIGGIRNFLVPTLAIPKVPNNDDRRIAELCAIFEKMNSTGVRLSVYDLLTARLYKYKIDQHALWETAVESHPLLNQFSDGKPDEYGIYTLRTIALIRGMDVKSSSLINFTPANYEADWRVAVNYMEKALERITSTNSQGFGVFDGRWAPYSTMVSPLAAMLYAIEHRGLDHRAYKVMRRWYWASVFRERYAGSVESTIYRDYQDFLRAATDPAFEPEAVTDARVNIVDNKAYSLRSINRVNSVYRGVMCLVALRGAKDFQSDDSIEFHTLEDHHIFPQAYLSHLKEHGLAITSADINCVLNRTLISAHTNRKISRSSPSEYLTKLVPADRTETIMRSHFIDDLALDAMRADNFEDFMYAREIELLSEIAQQITG